MFNAACLDCDWSYRSILAALVFEDAFDHQSEFGHSVEVWS